MIYQVEIKNSAKSDLRKIKKSNLVDSFQKIITQLKTNPFAPNQSFEKLTPPAAGKYSRRLNGQHRVVYAVNKIEQHVTIYSAWSYYN
ncbi:Txe/YoeB family addiction module toxin [Lactiplantibacillus modestisalitolerans]|uniref:Endoribonuclease YoeB n=1 Tax=Lactiplantibacillus modestisalitolerans TaxID=1457219 RepID=A0ABV5WSB7_9LACO|nr:Txe/YoeB family addiction module toxin [Lactiplantibacillus modestisalitolerans]